MKTYSIEKDSHRSGYYFKPVIGNTSLAFNAFFNDNCKYDIGNPDQYDINKLIGLSFGYHHKNSARIGWRYNTVSDRIELLPYIYVNGKRLTEDKCPVILTITTNQTVYGMISHEGSSYRIILYTQDSGYTEYKISTGGTKIPKLGYVLFPYFGGNVKTPHRMSIDMEYKLNSD
jgi:outer membrane protein assembly factor BamA